MAAGFLKETTQFIAALGECITNSLFETEIKNE